MRWFPSSLIQLGLVCGLSLFGPTSALWAEDIEIDLGSGSGAKATPAPAEKVKTASKASEEASAPAKPAAEKAKPAAHSGASAKSGTAKSGKSVVTKVVLGQPGSNDAQISIEGQGLPPGSVDKLSNNRVLVKFAKTSLQIPLKMEGDGKVVKGIRSSVHPGPTAWIVLDLLEPRIPVLERSETGYLLTLRSEGGAHAQTPAESPMSASSAKAGDEKPSEKSLFSRLIDASFKPGDRAVKLVLTTDNLSKYTVRKLAQPMKLILRFHNTKLEIGEKARKFKSDDLELKKGGLLAADFRQVGQGFSPISEAMLTLAPGTTYQVDRDLNQVIVTLTAPLAVEKPVERKGNINQLVSLDIEGADMNAVVKALATEAGFEVDMAAGAPLTGTVNEKFKDVPLKTALATILSQGSYDYEVEGNTLRMGPQAALKASKSIMPHLTEVIYPSGGLTPDQLDTLVRAVLKPTNAITTKSDPQRNVLVLNGTPADIDDFKKTIHDLKLDDGSGGDRITRVVKLNYINLGGDASTALNGSSPISSDILEILKPYLSPIGKVTPDISTHSLVIYDTPVNVGIMLEVIKELDRRKPQVLIESTIMEVDNENDLNLGVVWGAKRSVGDPTINAAADLHNSSAAQGSLSFGTVRSGLNLSAQIQALETRKKGKVISRPRIATESGTAANINEVENVVINQVTETIAQNGFATFTTSSSLFELPIDLTVVPLITDDGRITTTIKAKITSQTGPASATGLPPTNVQTATTKITTKNGETIVIGGLVRELSQEVTNGIPLLSSIPIIGSLFQQKDRVNRKSELVIFITPTMLED